MSTLVEGHQQSVEDFHQDVYKNLSLILNKVGCMQMSGESEHFVRKMLKKLWILLLEAFEEIYLAFWQ